MNNLSEIYSTLIIQIQKHMLITLLLFHRQAQNSLNTDGSLNMTKKFVSNVKLLYNLQ